MWCDTFGQKIERGTGS
uniref:Uncharacterized protein n=1 Tax=Anguilla anguilla TaxID=7936 RepID=A0A0E9SMA4_ANGAN